MMLKKMIQIFTVVTLMFSVFAGNHFALADSNNATEKAINEKLGPPIVVYGGSLSKEQKEKTKSLLNVESEPEVIEIEVTGADIKKYINGDPNSRMYSSAKITRLEKGKGIQVIQLTPENITEVTDNMYANALITAGVEDAKIEVASPIKVTGHSALTGIFKAYEKSGEKLDTVRLEVANEELDVMTSLVKDAGINEEKVSQLLTEIKQAIADQKPATKEDVEKIVEEQLKKLKIDLTNEQKQMLIDLFDKISKLDIDFNQVKEQLNHLAEDIKNKLEEAGIDKGFFQSVLDFIKGILQAIADFIKSIF